MGFGDVPLINRRESRSYPILNSAFVFQICPPMLFSLRISWRGSDSDPIKNRCDLLLAN